MKSTLFLTATVAVLALLSSPVLAGERTITKTEDGRKIERDYHTRKGDMHSENEVKKTGDGEWEGTRTITGPDGKTKTIETKGHKTEDGFHKDQSWTGKDGTTKTRTVDGKKNDDGTYTRTVKGANGEERSTTGETRKDARKKMHQERKDERKANRAHKGE